MVANLRLFGGFNSRVAVKSSLPSISCKYPSKSSKSGEHFRRLSSRQISSSLG